MTGPATKMPIKTANRTLAFLDSTESRFKIRKTPRATSPKAKIAGTNAKTPALTLRKRLENSPKARNPKGSASTKQPSPAMTFMVRIYRDLRKVLKQSFIKPSVQILNHADSVRNTESAPLCVLSAHPTRPPPSGAKRGPAAWLRLASGSTESGFQLRLCRRAEGCRQRVVNPGRPGEAGPAPERRRVPDFLGLPSWSTEISRGGGRWLQRRVRRLTHKSSPGRLIHQIMPRAAAAKPSGISGKNHRKFG